MSVTLSSISGQENVLIIKAYVNITINILILIAAFEDITFEKKTPIIIMSKHQ